MVHPSSDRFHDANLLEQGTPPFGGQEAHERLRKLIVEQEHFEALLLDLPSGVLIAEAPSGAILFGNHRIKQMIKHPVLYSPNVEAYGEWIGWHLDGSPVQPAEWPLARAVRGQSWSEDYLYRCGDESLIYIRAHGAPLRDTTGMVLAGMVTIDDITRQKQQEHERENMLQMVTHDLRAPVTTTQLSLQLMQRRIDRYLKTSHPPSSAQLYGELLEDIAKADGSLQIQRRLLDELSESLLFEMGEIALRTTVCDLRELMSEVQETQQRLCPKRLFRIEAQPQAPLLLLVDPFHIRQVMTNYLSNALKYAPEDQEILLGLQEETGQIRFWVRDHGPGLSPQEQHRIWDRFYRVPGRVASGAQGPSLGLGLSICKALIEQHHGQVGVDSEKGQGACFWFTLPKQKS